MDSKSSHPNVKVKLGKTIGIITSISATWNQHLQWKTLNKEHMTSKSEMWKLKTYVAPEHESSTWNRQPEIEIWKLKSETWYPKSQTWCLNLTWQSFLFGSRWYHARITCPRLASSVRSLFLGIASVCGFCGCRSMSLPFCLPACPSVGVSACLLVCLCTPLSVCLRMCLSVCVRVCVSGYLCVCQFVMKGHGC